MGGEKMSNDLENFDFLELGQAIQKAREKQRITREELAEELGCRTAQCPRQLTSLFGHIIPIPLEIFCFYLHNKKAV